MKRLIGITTITAIMGALVILAVAPAQARVLNPANLRAAQPIEIPRPAAGPSFKMKGSCAATPIEIPRIAHGPSFKMKGSCAATPIEIPRIAHGVTLRPMGGVSATPISIP